MTFTRAELVDELDLPWADKLIKQDRIIAHRRWSVVHEIVFEHPKTGKHYRTTFSVAATEGQDEAPWQYMDTVECEEVKLVENLVYEWEAV